MSSVTRFIRQIPVSTTYYDAASIEPDAATGLSDAYQFVPDTGNYVGNYTPGHMVRATAASSSAVGSGLYNLLLTTFGTAGTSYVLRDMGKTIKATYTNAAGALGTDVGFFREVQLLNPLALGVSTNTVIGGTDGSKFGVIGPSPAYLTLYISVAVGGVRGPAPLLNAYAIAGGQM
jgi:hypothetical protein